MIVEIVESFLLETDLTNKQIITCYLMIGQVVMDAKKWDESTIFDFLPKKYPGKIYAFLYKGKQQGKYHVVLRFMKIGVTLQ